MELKRLNIIVVSIFVSVTVSGAIQCYNCPAILGDSGCVTDEANLGQLQDCSGPWDACYKKTTDFRGTKRFDRGCTKMPSGLESGDCERLGFVEDTLVETICYCDEDECNSARPASAASIGLLLAVVMFAVKALLQRDA